MESISKFFILLSILIAQLHAFCQHEGRVEMRRHVLDFDRNHKDSVITVGIWYSGSRSIQAIPRIVVKKDTASSFTTEIKYFLFIDSSTHQHLYFKSFSDTAQFVAKSTKDDLFSKYGGWNMYAKTDLEYDKMKRLNDTMIDKRRFVRYSLLKVNGNDSFNFVVYGSDSDKHQRIRYLPLVSRRIGCPVVRMDTYYNGRLTGRVDIVYTANHLSAAEKRVFNAWAQKLR